jgi:tRNA dimethylallyltransferase
LRRDSDTVRNVEHGGGIGGAKVIALVGATGVGKTRVAIELCRRLDGEIIGADSVQVYRGLDIGSGKPTPAELGDVRHHMIDVVAPDEPIDAARFAALADAAIADVVRRGRVPIVVGGTGLWLRALLRGLVQAPPMDAALRAELERRWVAEGRAAMHARLRDVDPITAGQVHENDMVRVVRALEFHAQTGRALGQARAEHALGAPRYDALWLWLDQPREPWLQAVEARIDGMLAAGWLREVRELLERHSPPPRSLGSVGYRQLVDHLTRGVPLEETRREISRATRLYGKRQRNWFRGEPGPQARIEPAAAMSDESLARVRTHLDLSV